ncbi:amino acid adenylation domain-containing protein, partial [Janthinobacterium sp.]|uniref:amino acid adenylation domain-containing protein n=1 Tax=Janthinobacterium sp. TaxID=1871054 RepID=UPI00258F7D42
MLLHQKIELQAARTPDALAVCLGAQRLTYAELERQANQCARYLRELGVGPDVIVGLLMERSLEMVIALLGVMKAGGAYLPLDPAWPQARLDFLLDDADAPVLITLPSLSAAVAHFTGTLLVLEPGLDTLSGYDGAPLEAVNGPDDLAYVIYTSGSTGQPKGCMLSHRAICNRLDWMQETYRLSGDDRVLQKTPYTFDVSVWEFFWPLLAGATLVLAKPGGHKDSRHLAATIRQEGITVCHFVPSMLRFFVDDPQAAGCTSLRDVFTSGEALPFDLLRRFKEVLPARLHNLYGPTEAAVDVSYWECHVRADRIVPIGRAIANIALHVLDASGRPLPRGQEGELYISGVGLARGYLNRPELTAERFVQGPSGDAADRMYRTGDRVRELEDGNIQFLGRTDFQVKLRGLRIELGEIEAALREFPGVNEAVVLVRGEDEGDPRLVAYLACAGQGPDWRAVRDFAAVRLPGYMVPNIVVVLAQLPVTPHGKLDRHALPWPVASGAAQATPAAQTAGDTAAPVQPAEVPATTDLLAERVRAFVASVLGCDQLSDAADLFDLGATSLSLIRVVEWISQEYGIDVPVEILLDPPTVSGIVAYLGAQGVSDAVMAAAASVQATRDVRAVLPDHAAADAASNGVGMDGAAPAAHWLSLPAPALRATAYLPLPAARFTDRPLDIGAVGAWLMLLGAESKDGRDCYLHPSAGGLNAVRTYVAVKPGKVGGLDGGIYYFHPLAHSLHRVGEMDAIGRAAFESTDRIAYDSAALALFFVAAIDAVQPLYQEHSAPLMSVEAGYMAQLLASHQAACGLATRPVVRVDFDAIASGFALAGDERFVHCLLAGAAPAGPADAAHDRLAELRRCPPPVSATILSHRPSAVAAAPLSSEAMARFHDEHRHLRDVAAHTSCKLDAGAFSWDDYRLRRCQRDYETAALPLDALGGLLALCRPGPDGAYLFASPAGQPGWQVSLYVREGRVAGLAQGAYRYDAARHALTRCGELSDAAMAQAYSPYNRKHYKAAAFCLFLTAQPYAGLEQDEAIHLPLLESGYLGQLLMQHQAEFDLGLCPIGGMRFELVRATLGVADEAVLLHSFTGGAVHHELGAGQRRVLEPEQSEVRVPAARIHDLAIVGLDGRYPGAADLDDYWDKLKAGASSIGPMAEARRVQMVQGAPQAMRNGGYLEQIDCFDNLLFGISPAEARMLDPQERLLLESAWTCLENAGYTAETLLRGGARVGVFIGAMWNDYQTHGAQLWEQQGRIGEFSHHATLANRLSFVFNFSGPSVAINTSCSSGMTALHLACESVRHGQCDVALVGAVNLISHLYHARVLETLDLLSKTGACQPFSAQADGWVLGEGVGTVLIKPAAAALRDRDHVHAVIAGSAIGHAGRTVRYGVPNAQQQEQAMRAALADAGLVPDDIDYIEAAAPGAGMADAAEMSAVKAVFGRREAHKPCYVGTVKANIGHLESASMFSQLTKVLCQLRERQLAPSLNSRPRNPLIALGSGLCIVEQLTPWTNGAAAPLRAMINAVGAAGSGGHLVLQEYVAAARGACPAQAALVPLSAATGRQLRLQVQQLLDFLARAPDTHLHDVAFTLQHGRAPMAERLACVVADTQALRAALSTWLAGAPQEGTIWQGRAQRDAHAASAGSDLPTLARRWSEGAAVEWDGADLPTARRLPLPTYPFEPVRHWIGAAPAPHAGADVPQTPPSREQEAAWLRERVLARVLPMVAGVTEMPAAALDADAPLAGYGLSSLMIQALNGQLEQAFGTLSKSVFFEVRTVRELADYVVDFHRVAAQRLCGVTAPAAAPIAAATAVFAVAAHDGGQAPAREAIAVVGLSGRYAKSATLGEFWANLVQGVDCISEIAPERWDHSRYFDSARGQPGKTYSKWGGFIDGVDEFDPMFFGMTPREAALVDPQERLFLQEAWHAVEDAGYTRASLRSVLARRVGVFVGAMYGEYQLYPSLPQGLALSGSHGTIANRVSYALDLHGPSMAIDTMCSSSLTAIHLACESIRRGECTAAIAGGVCLSLHPNKYVTHALLGMASSDGRCRSFGQGGDGFVPGEGVGAVLLKPLSAAQADGDHIYGVIKGMAVSHGGRTNGFTVPDPRAQAATIREALVQADVAPHAVSYIEAHGTGTELGDPIEIAGLAQAFGAPAEGQARCAIGSAKSNIGHCESAAGIAGLSKVLLQMRHKTLVKSLHSARTNAAIDFPHTPFAVQTDTAPWPRPVFQGEGGPREGARIAGISSFGAGGANAHMVVEEYTAPERPAAPSGAQPAVAIVLSAMTAEALRAAARQLRDTVAAGTLTDALLADAAYTLQVGREAMAWRLACVVGSAAALQARLDAWLEGGAGAASMMAGEVSRHKEARDALSATMADGTPAGTADGNLASLLGQWVQGAEFDWQTLYDGSAAPRPRRTSLPGYPFARERYWVEQPADAGAARSSAAAALLHPLLHRNTSDLEELRFSTYLSGTEFFLADHVVQGKHVLPGVASLEMARAAMVLSAGAPADAGIRLRNVAWPRPLVAGAGTALEVQLVLQPQLDDTVGFALYSGDDLVHSEGTAEVFPPGGAERLELDALRAQCSAGVVAGIDCYARFAQVGLDYGPGHQALQTVYLGERMALARLQL